MTQESAENVELDQREPSSEQGKPTALASTPSGIQDAEGAELGMPARKKTRRLMAGMLLAFVLVAGAVFHFASEHLAAQKTAEFKGHCKVAAEKKDWNRLKSISNQWLEWDEGSDDARIFIAEAAIQMDDTELAVDMLGAVSDSYHGVLDSLLARGDLLFQELNRPFEAEKNWLRMLKINERADSASRRLLYYYALTLQREKLLAEIDRCMKFRCESPEAYTYLILANVLNFSDGLSTVTRWRRAVPDNEMLEVAQAVYAAKKAAGNSIASFGIQTVTPGETTLLNACLKKYPQNLEVLSVQIEFAIFVGDTGRVVELLANVQREAETDSRFWRYRGWVLAQNGNYEQAAESLEAALRIHPYEWQSRVILADVYRRLGNAKQADLHSGLASQGKELQQHLFELPTSRDLDDQSLKMIHEYLKKLGPTPALDALSSRLM